MEVLARDKESVDDPLSIFRAIREGLTEVTDNLIRVLGRPATSIDQWQSILEQFV